MRRIANKAGSKAAGGNARKEANVAEKLNLRERDLSACDTALCLIATGKYTRFLRQVMESAATHWPRAMPVVLTDDPDAVPSDIPHLSQHWPHRSWPYPTLLRYHAMLSAESVFRQFAFMFYCDVDMVVVARMEPEPYGEGRAGIDGELVGVTHPGFAGAFNRARYTYENRKESRAYVARHEGTVYYAGGFQGGATERYLHAARGLSEMADDDLSRGIIPLWADESLWNRYCIDHPPTVTLSTMFCLPDSWRVPQARLLAITKNHHELRS